MKISNLLFYAGCIAVFAAACPDASATGPVVRRGTSVLHYMTQSALVSTDAGSNIVGSLRLQQNEQGHSSKQSFDLRLKGLEAGASYQLTAIMGDDTNAVPVAGLSADTKGRSSVRYMSLGQGKGHGRKEGLPAELTPLVDVRAIGLDNASTQTVAYAWIADAGKFHYLVKRNLTPEDEHGTAAGQISLIANHRKVSFRLLAGGLNAGGDYHLALNSNIVATVTATDTGRLELKSWPAGAPDVLELRSLSLLDGSSNVVLRTALPK